MAFITKEDLEPFAVIAVAKAEAMIADAEAQAVLTAPCLPGLLSIPDGETPEDEAIRLAKLAAVKGILRGAILRWEDAGTGGTQSIQQTAGPFGQMHTFVPAARKGLFWPSELEDLQGICGGEDQGKAYSFDTVPTESATDYLHTPWCSYRFGALYCSCGVDLTGTFPLYEILPDSDNVP